MAFRLSVSEAPDLTAIRVVGRLGNDAVALLSDACDQARRPVVLDLSELTSASDAGALLLRRLEGGGVHLLGASHYVRLLLERGVDTYSASAQRRRRGPRPASQLQGADRGRLRHRR